MEWIERSAVIWDLKNSGVTEIVAFIFRFEFEGPYRLYIWDAKQSNFEVPIKLLTLEDAMNIGTMLVKIKYSEVLNGMAS
jgi:hypothetical protein